MSPRFLLYLPSIKWRLRQDPAALQGANYSSTKIQLNSEATYTLEKMITAATKLRQALQDPNAFITAPGVYDGLSARIALNVGFDALYMVCVLLPAYIFGRRADNHFDRPVLVPLHPSTVKRTLESAP